GPARGVQRAFLGNWFLSSVVTLQSGTALTIANTNGANVFGISEDRAQLSGICSNGALVKSGSVGSKLNGYFNPSCFADSTAICGCGLATAVENSSTGTVDGSAQANLDLAVSKTWPFERCSLQLRAEFYNALNHPQFSNPDANFSSPTFGVISGTSVSPRVGQ